MTSKFSELCIDCKDPRSLAQFWSAILDWTIEEDDEGEDYIYIEGSSEPGIAFIKVPEGKTVKNRLHIDVTPTDGTRDQEVERVLGLGATRVDIGQGEQRWVVLADPEGNEFCILGRKEDPKVGPAG